MDDMQEKLGAILDNPAMMQQIFSMAQSLGASGGEPPPGPPQQPAPSPQEMQLLQGLMTAFQRSGVDKNQQALLHALGPYLRADKLGRLEKAMRAAKLASFASSALGSGALSSLLGR